MNDTVIYRQVLGPAGLIGNLILGHSENGPRLHKDGRQHVQRHAGDGRPTCGNWKDAKTVQLIRGQAPRGSGNFQRAGWSILMALKFAYHPGNVAHSSAPEVADTMIPASRTLGIELHPPEGQQAAGQV